MNFLEFITKLRSVAATRQFCLTEGQKWLRTTDDKYGGEVCPIDAVAGNAIGPSYFTGLNLGLSGQLCFEIMRAADNHSNYGATRKALLDACGLVE